MRSRFSIIIYAVMALAVFGLASQLFGNTAAFLKSIVFMIGTGVLFFALIYFLFLRKRTTSSEMKKYRQAVKHSKMKYGPKTQKRAPSTKPSANKMRKSPARRRPRANHLRVIEGNKNKRNKRASN